MVVLISLYPKLISYLSNETLHEVTAWAVFSYYSIHDTNVQLTCLTLSWPMSEFYQILFIQGTHVHNKEIEVELCHDVYVTKNTLSYWCAGLNFSGISCKFALRMESTILWMLFCGSISLCIICQCICN